MFARGRHQAASSRGRRWAAAAAGLAVAGATVLAMAPAQANTTTVDAQLSLSGVATKANILGGTTIGVHPGDTVDFKASALPTAGLANIPSLGTTLIKALDGLLGQYQVVVTFGRSFPSIGSSKVTLGGPKSGKCAGKAEQPVRFGSAGTYTFTWTVRYVLPGLLGCSTNGVSSSTLNQLKAAGIALNASNQWTGQVVVATNPPPPGISIQLPGMSVSPSLPVVGQLPGVGLPGLSLPTLPLSLPDLGGGVHLPGGKSTGSGGHTGTNPSDGSSRSPGGLTIPEQVVPRGYGDGPGTLDLNGFGNALPNLGSGGLAAAGGSSAGASAGPTLPNATAAAKQKSDTVDLASKPDSSTQLPVLLAIIAIIALSLVTATYARLYLLRKPTA